ncbi:DNA helicase [Phycicoccus sp. BSK3Z-2]|uniref:DNA helicase n=1 Tax=Phycicoccus avicenniae TaxID=2828860 RepID=A0A941HYI9_9MICO|nr:cory-CC-star protein [Phycicoccus avicenniae]MBR7741920.1 DNA helicase [Phycicoccus avicenniae]
MTGDATRTGTAGRLRAVADVLGDVLAGPYARTFARARQDEDDLFMVVVMAEALGVPNPASYYTVELLPVVYDQVHDWHRRMGLDRSPLDHFSCC